MHLRFSSLCGVLHTHLSMSTSFYALALFCVLLCGVAAAFRRPRRQASSAAAAVKTRRRRGSWRR